MSQINVSDADKDRFDELKPSEKTQKEFFSEVMATYETADETVTLDTERLTAQIAESVASEIELAAYRGTTEAIENAHQ